MTQKFFKILTYFLFLVTFCSCSTLLKHFPRTNKNKLESTRGAGSQASSTLAPEQLTKHLEKQMEVLRKQAQEAGPEAVKFLATDLFIKANDVSMRGDSLSAAFLFHQIVQLVPNDEYVKKKYAIELVRMGKLKKAKPYFIRFFKKEYRKDEAVGLVLGGIHTSLGEMVQAKRVYRKLLKAHPKSEEACVFLAKLYGSEKKYQKAEALLSRCSKYSRGRGIFNYYKGKLAATQKKRALAIKYFSRSLAVDPSYYQAALAKGLMFEEQEKFQKAIGVYKFFLKLNPNSYPVLSRLVQLKFATQSLKGIISYAERLTALDPSDLNLKVRLGILYSDQKRFKDAKSIFKEILIVVPGSNRVLYYLGSLYQQTQDYEVAIEYFSKISDESPLFYDSSIQVAQLLRKLANHSFLDKSSQDEKAMNRFIVFASQRIERHQELKVELSIMLATFYESRNEIKEAIKTLSSIKGLKGYEEGHEYYLASLYEKLKDYKTARGLIVRMLEKNPKNPHALNFLGYSLLDTGDDLEKAYSLIAQALSLKPDDGYIRDSLGWYYYKIGRYRDALREIRKARRLVKDDAVIIKHLAMVYQKLNKYDQAKKYFVEALGHCKYESEKNEVRKAIENLESLRLPASKRKASSSYQKE